MKSPELVYHQVSPVRLVTHQLHVLFLYIPSSMETGTPITYQLGGLSEIAHMKWRKSASTYLGSFEMLQ